MRSTAMENCKRTICDPVHGHISIHPLCNLIIDTSQFQRLRYINQLGFCDYVFPGAVNNRFSHSLGVSYIAGLFIRQIRSAQPELDISTEEILCVEIAGLCHDLGHAPFSHSWEVFMKTEAAKRDSQVIFKHEEVSLNMLEYLIKVNHMEEEFLKYNLTKEHVQKIKNMICGNVVGNEDRAFLYQIINNDSSGLDVDKWDYFLRDAYYCGLKTTFDYERLMSCARVNEVDGMKQICFRDKEGSSVLNMFRTRNHLHETVYSHRVVRLIEALFCEAMSLCYKHLKICPELDVGDIWEWSADAATTNEFDSAFLEKMEKYSCLTDDTVVAAIFNLNATSPDHLEAKRLLKSFKCHRSFTNEFQWIGKIVVKKEFSEEETKDEILKHFPSSPVNCVTGDILRKHIFIQITKNHYGKCEKNPLNFVYFYSKRNIHQAKRYDPSEMNLDLPVSFQKIEIRVLGRNCDERKISLLRLCFESFKDELSSN